MSPKATTTLGSETLEILHGLPLLYRFNGHAIKTIQRVHPDTIDKYFDGKRHTFVWAGKEFEMGPARFGHYTLIVSTKGLTDKEKVELAKWLAGS